MCHHPLTPPTPPPSINTRSLLRQPSSHSNSSTPFHPTQRTLTMGEKKGKNGGEKKQNNNGEGEKKGDDGPITVVLKVDMHCEGCATKLKKCVRGFEGVESVRGDCFTNKLTVNGKVDPMKLREMVEQKAKKKVELISPLPKKEKENKGAGGGGEQKAEGKPEKKPDEKKTKEPSVTTAVMKLDLHCLGCIKKIRRTIRKIKGFHEMSIDNQKNLVTVKGTMDMKALAETLKERLKKPVEIIPPKKDGDKKEKGGGDGGGGGGDKKEKGGQEGKGKGKNKNAGEGGGNGGGQGEQNIIQHTAMYPNPYVYGYGLVHPMEQGYPGYPGYPMEHYQYNAHAPQIFSDENPNACSIM